MFVYFTALKNTFKPAAGGTLTNVIIKGCFRSNNLGTVEREIEKYLACLQFGLYFLDFVVNSLWSNQNHRNGVNSC